MNQQILPYYKELQSFAYAYLKQRADIVDDIVQETYIDVFEKYHLPLPLISLDKLIEICKVRCKNAYSEIKKHSGIPILNDIDSDTYLDLVNYRNAIFPNIEFDINFREIESIKARTGWTNLDDFFSTKNIINEEEHSKHKQVRFSNKFIFDQVKDQWKKNRSRYLRQWIDGKTHKCKCCGDFKPNQDFIENYNRDGVSAIRKGFICLSCKKKKNREKTAKFYFNNKEKVNKRITEWRKSNPEYMMDYNNKRCKKNKIKVEQLDDTYIVNVLLSQNKLSREEVFNNPKLIEDKRKDIQMKRDRKEKHKAEKASFYQKKQDEINKKIKNEYQKA